MSSKRALMSLAQAAEKRDNRSIEVISAQVNKDLGPGTVVRGSDMIKPPKRLSTGSLWWDLALGGGWPQNAWSEVIGFESSGKTTGAMHTIAFNQKLDPKFTALWAAAEPFDAEFAKAIGIDLNRLWVLEENTMEIVYEKVTEYVLERSVDMAVIDAYPSLVTESEDVAHIGDMQVSPGARLTGKFMRRATKATKRSLIDPTDRSFTGLFINQWRQKITMFGDPKTTPGGIGKNFWFAARVEISRADWILDEDKYAVGQTIKLNAFKNKSARPRLEGLCDFYFAEYDGHEFAEFDHAGEVYKLCTALDVVERRGNTYYFGDLKLAVTQGRLEDMIRADADLCRKINNEIRHQQLGEVFAPKAPTRIRRRPVITSKAA